MENNTSIRYQALNESSYNSLAAFATTVPGITTLCPEFQTIVATEEAADEMGKFIDDNGLDFHIYPIVVDDDNIGEAVADETTDANTLRCIILRMMEQKQEMTETHAKELADMTRLRDEARRDRDVYRKWYKEANDRTDSVKKQVDAIAVLMSSIFPPSGQTGYGAQE